MADGEVDGIQVPYHRGLKPLEKLLAAVRRPGDFFVRAAFETAMPRVEVAGVGTLSFPVPEAQVRQLIERASRAPFGRGEETILDESVRKVWQLLPDQVRLGGKSWDKTFAGILAAVTDGLGCGAEASGVVAELYKLLVYDEGGFFKPHRDTEKRPGMFGTMIVVLPAAHRGGELIVRHAGREVTLDLGSAEVSELRVAAFYADCEHEVRPIAEGYRVCLVYNLIQRGGGARRATLTAPAYHGEIEAAAKRLREAFAAAGAPTKLAWLFRHQYSPAGLSFAGLKGEDVALAKTLRRAAEAAGCAVHLGIVHIEETGPAEADYGDYQGGWGDEDEDEEDANFEVVEVSDSRWHVGEWHDVEDHPVDFGDLPLAEGEVLPAGALDGQEPDERRLLEATGNEGASFERSYHRAALVLWPRDRFADVLLQAGVGAVLPHLNALVNDLGGSGGAGKRQPVLTLARRVVKQWEEESGAHGPADVDLKKNPSRPEMIRLLMRLGDGRLLERFIGAVVTPRFDGSENEALAAAAGVLGPTAGARLFPALAWEKAAGAPRAVVGLLGALVRELGRRGAGLDARWKEALAEMAAAVVAALPELKPPPEKTAFSSWSSGYADSPSGRLAQLVRLSSGRDADAPKTAIVDAGTVTELLASLFALGAGELRAEAVTAITGNTATFDPVTVIVPALTASAVGAASSPDVDLDRLWRHAARFLLTCSEQPPIPPTDWALKARVACPCEDCRELQAFAQDPVTRVHRFRVKQSRRQHLHQTIERLGLDMTHETERKGSPQTLVCTKTRRIYEDQCAQHRADVMAMSTLLDGRPAGPGEVARLSARMEAARGREAAAA